MAQAVSDTPLRHHSNRPLERLIVVIVTNQSLPGKVSDFFICFWRL